MPLLYKMKIKNHHQWVIFHLVRVWIPQPYSQHEVHRLEIGDSYCDYCHMRGHTREQCFKLKFCDHCKSRGHLRETCYQLIGYPADFKGKKKVNVVTRNGHSRELPQSQLSSGHGKQFEQSQLIQGNNIPKFFSPDQCAQIEQLLRKSSFGEASASMARTNVNIAGNVTGNTGSVQLPTGETSKVSSIGTCQLDGQILCFSGPAHWECEGDW
uniref:Putative ovule protein n=1 Tax=Solanum chacoense TaxID=4108 RepID=A0A0V0I6E1_SOLCH